MGNIITSYEENVRVSQEASAIRFLLNNIITMSMYNSIVFLYSPHPFQHT
jgi:hypothetical protein